MKTEDIPKHRSCKRQKDIKAHLHAHLKTRLRMMPSSLLGCASQFVSGLYPTYRPCIYIYIYINEYMSLSYLQMSNYICMYVYIYISVLDTYIHASYTHLKCVPLCRVWLLPGHPKSPACLPRVTLPERCGAWRCCHKRGSPHMYIYIYICVCVCVSVCV